MLRFPLTVRGADVVVSVADTDVTVGDALGGGSPIVVSTSRDDRIVPADIAVLDAALRPGNVLRVHTDNESWEQSDAFHGLDTQSATDGSLVDVASLGSKPVWGVHLLAGVDSGRIIPIDPAAPIVTFGRSADMNVCVPSNGVSTHHCTITIHHTDPNALANSNANEASNGPTSTATGTVITVTDVDSRNGTVIRNQRTSGPVTVSPGEVVRCGPSAFSVRRLLPDDAPRIVSSQLETATSGPVAFYRSPVDLPPGPGPEVAAPEGARKPKTGRPGLLGLMIPIAMASAIVFFTGNWMFALFALMGPVMMLISTADKAGRNRKTRKKSRKRYKQEVLDFERELQESVAEEVVRRWQMYPDLAELCRRANASGIALWSRRPSHPQFLALSLGVADIPWTPTVNGMSDEVEELEDLVEQYKILPQAPLAVAAKPGTTLGFAGNREATMATVRGLLVQVAALSGPAEVRMVIVCGAAQAQHWDWMKWLPHTRPSFAGGRLLAVVADEDGNLDGAAIDDVLSDADATTTLVVVIDTVGLADAGDLAVRRLLRRTEIKATGLVLAATVDGLPDQCVVVIDHHQATGEATCRWPQEAGRSLDFVVGGVSEATALEMARALAKLSDPDAGGGSASLPAQVGMLEVLQLGGSRATEINTRWTDAESGSATLAAVVGIGEGGTVRINLDTDGPHLVVVGARGSGKSEQLTSLIMSLCTNYAPDRLHLVLWGESFGHLHRLPHVASAVSRVDDATLGMVMEGLDRELSRRERLRTQSTATRTNMPSLVIVIDDVDMITRIAPISADHIVRLLRRARGLGVHVMWSTSRHAGGIMNELVDLSQIRVVLRVGSVPDSNDLLGTDAAARLERSLPGRGYLVSGRSEPREVQGGAVSVGAPQLGEPFEVNEFSLALGRSGFTRVRLGQPDERALVALLSAAGLNSPRPVDILSPASAAVATVECPGLLELLAIDERGGLAEATDHWHTIDGEGFLRVPVGVDPEMRPVYLDIKESAQAGMGPHGLLVGATGSGKSELLRTLVCGLALMHSPEALAFVLVDFKGGASFASYARLPHVSGVVTNLADDLALVDRILAALGGELKRRQEMLAKAGNLGNVREYRTLHRAGKLPDEIADQAMPELLLVVDEFAELLDTEPGFIDFFLTIGRVGRSLGIHLLLASQRLEEGKLRGLDTYLSYRLGLRTFSAAESRTVLGVPDAYSLPQAPGGGYLKVGTSSFERFQASYVSGVDDEGLSVMDRIIERLTDSADAAHQIWLPPLGSELPLDPLMGGFVNDPERGFAAAGWPGTGALAVPVGVADEPAKQRQLPLALDFAGAQGNLAIAGAPQSGKSVLLRTMVLSLAVTHTPNEVQIYGVDFGGGGLESLSGLPHVGTVASRLDPDLVRRVVGHVEATLTQREALFREHSIDSVQTFRQMKANGELPPEVGGDVFLIIDGWAGFKERFEMLEGTIADLASRGLGYGVHVVVTLNRWMEMRPAVLDAIGGRLELRLNSAMDSMIDRKRAGVIRANQPGRGLHPSTLVFQVSLPRLDGRDSTDSLTAATKVAVDHVASRWTGWTAPEVKLLPTAIDVEVLRAQAEPDASGVVVGLMETGMAPWSLDLTGSEPHFVVYGDSESGKTTFLTTWLTGLCERFTPDQAQVVLIDYRRTLLGVVPKDHLQGYGASEPAAQQVIADVLELAKSRLPGVEVTAQQLRDRSWWTGPDLYVVVDDFDLIVTPSGNPVLPLLSLLAQGRDVGLHLVTARRVGGAGKMAYEPITARVREVSPAGIILSGDRDEGQLIGNVRASEQPPGRGVLVTRRGAPVLIQVGLPAALVAAE
jgi:DNA segregation ATPase FtsK/SpoIIIE, S-DNA-T family